MTKSLNDILSEIDKKNAATTAGTQMHAQMARASDDPELMQCIKSVPGLNAFFGSDSRVEVPVAGFIKGKFISRRIDRMRINHAESSIAILDYKTDTDKSRRHDEYVDQLSEYVNLLRQIYPGYTISAHILWLHDWHLEQII